MKVIILHAYSFSDIAQICQKQVCQMNLFLRSNSNDLLKVVILVGY